MWTVTKKYFLVLSFLMTGSFYSYAQVNPKQGYVITNENDTIVGVIDYRSDNRNAQECIFQKEGSGDKTVYTPADIKGYRFENNGAFYVSKTVDIDNKPRQLFAEYLLKGGVSLYFISTNSGAYYYFEGENGKAGLVKERDFLDYNAEEQRDIRRQDMNILSQIFYKSNETVQKLWSTAYDKNSLTLLTRRYSEQYCTGDEDCIQYLYDSKKTAAFKVRFRVGAGVKVGNITPKYIRSEKNDDFSLSAFSPNVSIGCDLLFPRLSKHFIAQVGVDLGYLKATKDSHQLTGCTVQTQWGAAYIFQPEYKLSPMIRGGITFNHLIGASGKDMDMISGNNKKAQDIDYGFYIGAGIDIAVSRHTLRLSANYEYSTSLGLFKAVDGESLKTSVFAIKADLIF